eukprot:3396866-Prymnesium_polylepis.1
MDHVLATARAVARPPWPDDHAATMLPRSCGHRDCAQRCEACGVQRHRVGLGLLDRLQRVGQQSACVSLGAGGEQRRV